MKRHLLLLALLIPTVSNHLSAQYGKPEYHIGLVERTITKAPNGKYILWKYPNKKVISNADSIKLRKNRWYYVWKKGKQGLYNERKEPCIPIKYDAIVQITDNLFRVEKNGKKGVYNSNGTKVLSPIYDEIIEKGFWFGNNGCLKVGKDGKYGICNEHGIPITKLIYSKIKGNSDKLELVKGNTSDFLLNYKYLVYDYKTIKDAFSVPVNGIETKDYFVFKKDSLFGLLNEKGEMVITPPIHKTYKQILRLSIW
ncbi:UNVERIFIED_CONTAM: WG repeat-containing protein [Prevotella sp. 15_C9]